MTYLTAKEARALASGDDDFVRIMDPINRAVGRRQFSITVEPVKVSRNSCSSKRSWI
jgi:hypothetical protein